MHEMVYVDALIKRLKKEKNYRRIKRVRITINKASGIQKDSFLYYWDYSVRSTLLKHTAIIFRNIKTTLSCLSCHHTWKVYDDDYMLVPCPKCKSRKTYSKDSSRVYITSIDYETTQKTT